MPTGTSAETSRNELVCTKVEQAVAIVAEREIDAWLTFVRETDETGDPVLPIILGQPLTWQSALIVARTGERIAIVGAYEDEPVRAVGAWTEVIPYVESIRAPLVETLDRLAPRRIAINYALGDVKADGLSHGMYLLLGEYLAGTVHADRLESASAVIAALRGRKTAAEMDRLHAAIDTTSEIFGEVAAWARPGRTETEISRFMHDAAARRGVGTAWSAGHCPIVTTGSDSMVGHGVPSPDLSIRPGNVFHLDFGVRRDGYCSDVQRVWYVPSEAEPEPPPALCAVFSAVRASIDAAAAVLAPGVRGWEVDAAARETLRAAGYPDYRHATGHEVGRAAHDGGSVLGPRWERYGDTTDRPVESGNVFTLELGVENADGRGYVGLEEMVRVTDGGAEPMTAPQRALWTLGTPVDCAC